MRRITCSEGQTRFLPEADLPEQISQSAWVKKGSVGVAHPAPVFRLHLDDHIASTETREESFFRGSEKGPTGVAFPFGLSPSNRVDIRSKIGVHEP